MEYKVKPWAHQLEAINKNIKKEYYALFFDAGTGKTATLINILRHKFGENGRVLRTLILCPLVVVENWKREWQMNSFIDPRDLVALKGSGAKRREQFEAAWADRHNFVMVANYESLAMPDLYARWAQWQPEVLVLDESHKIKDPTSKRAKLVMRLGDKVPYRYILTGTPILNSVMDIYSQFKFLDNGRTLGTSYHAFKNRYMFDKNAKNMNMGFKNWPDWKEKQGTREEIARLIAPHAAVVKKKDCLDLPPLVRQTIAVELDEKQRAAYNEMRKHLITFLKGEAVTAQIALTKALRLMQIASGYATTEEGTIHEFDNPKARALKDLLETITVENKVIVWAVFKQNYKTIRKVCEDLKIEYVELHGEVVEKDRQANIDAFNTNRQIKVLIGHPGSGGIGVNLTAASYAIYFSRDFSLEHDLQSEARNYRGGSEVHQSITRIDLVCKDTIDEVVVEKLVNKEQIGNDILSNI